MIKSILLAVVFCLVTPAFAYEVPKVLRDLLKNQKEQIYIGTKSNQDACEMKVFENKQGFHIEAYERDHNGNIDRKGDFGRFTLNDNYELYDFWQDALGFEAVSYYYSSFGSIYDEKSILKVDKYTDAEKFVDITFKKHNGYFMYTHYRFKCWMKL
jgi:hypothetical protein